MKILVINGPNINMLGIREKNIYGAETYEDLKALLEKTFAEKGVEGEIYQSNHEGDLVDRIQQAYFDGTEGIVMSQAFAYHGNGYSLFFGGGGPRVARHVGGEWHV